MKKLFALGAALLVLLFSFSVSVETAVVENSGVQVCSDLPLDPVPYNNTL